MLNLNDEMVREMIKWAATGIDVTICAACGKSGEDCDNCHRRFDDAETLAKQILSHPELIIADHNPKDRVDMRGTLYYGMKLADVIKMLPDEVKQ